MKIIKINKTARNSVINHYLVLNDSFSDVAIDEMVEEWCESEPSGFYYGYSYEWDIVTDNNEKINTLKNELNSTSKSLENLKGYKKILELELEELKYNI